MANEEKAQWEWDTKNPYLNKMATASALQNASMSNIMTGIEGVEGGAMQIAGMIMANKQNKSMGAKTGDTGATMAPQGNMNIGQIPGGYTPPNELQSPDMAGNFLSSPRPDMGQLQYGFGGSPRDDWSMFGGQMQQAFPGIDPELLKEQMPFFKQNYLKSYYGY